MDERERAVSMMKVLANDGGYEFGRGLSGDDNPLGLTLGGLVYNEGRILVSLRVDVIFRDDEE
jgi:hypothetical protein